MRKLALYILVIAFTVQAISLFAQTTEKPEPRFTLALLMGHHGGEISKNEQVLLVRLTNTSNEVIYDQWCLAFHGMYDLAVTYNGVPVEDTEDQKAYKKFRQAGRCNGSTGTAPINPGEYRDQILYYNTTKPGTYEFTVSRETFPWDPEKSVTVKSNTLTIVVPEPATVTPK